ncbi:MAG: hypothetical protein AVDCRST_MAG05-3641 [uncultured Rubrobacteraceae bacterium]|uniref:Uncharacterized protein n=1 Tax=uncultured Rubrobacteraceae bacterium TaxID=349277 RepID=A0A6J4TES3_9ACTN|nr:MAG: hypothetical protein AVDCRST_MAG05-3641 [uncultured Rubrobacteraceae bacterium]
MSSPRGRRPTGHERAVGTSERAYRSLLRAYPRGLRDEYGDEMVRLFRDLCREELEDGGLGLATLWARTLPELLYTAIKERSTMLARNAYRSVAGVALAAAFILLIPLLAGWPWNVADFVFAGALIFGTGFAFVLAARRVGNNAYRAAVGVALAAAFILVWLTGAVGIIGSEDNNANLMYFGVLAVGIIGAIVARFRQHGMARALFATALAQALVALIALIIGLSSPWSPPGVLETLILNGFFVALFAGSALLFRYAAREQTPAGAGPEG